MVLSAAKEPLYVEELRELDRDRDRGVWRGESQAQQPEEVGHEQLGCKDQCWRQRDRPLLDQRRRDIPLDDLPPTYNAATYAP